MENTIQGLLDFARPPALDRARHDLRETVQRAVSLVEGRAKQQQVAVRLDLPEPAVIVDADHAQIHQVFVNLLLNGIEAAGRGGVLHVLAREADNREAVSDRVPRFRKRYSRRGPPERSSSRLSPPRNTARAWAWRSAGGSWRSMAAPSLPQIIRRAVRNSPVILPPLSPMVRLPPRRNGPTPCHHLLKALKSADTAPRPSTSWSSVPHFRLKLG